MCQLYSREAERKTVAPGSCCSRLLRGTRRTVAAYCYTQVRDRGTAFLTGNIFRRSRYRPTGHVDKSHPKFAVVHILRRARMGDIALRVTCRYQVPLAGKEMRRDLVYIRHEYKAEGHRDTNRLRRSLPKKRTGGTGAFSDRKWCHRNPRWSDTLRKRATPPNTPPDSHFRPARIVHCRGCILGANKNTHPRASCRSLLGCDTHGRRTRLKRCTRKGQLSSV